MLVKVNDQPIQLQQGVSLADLLLQLEKLESKGIAVALNQEVISKKHWSGTLLQEADQVILIHATQGG